MEIRQLERIKNKQNLKRLGLKINDFLYGYQDWVVKKFENLEVLNDVKLPPRKLIQDYWIKAENIANYLLEFNIRLNRAL